MTKRIFIRFIKVLTVGLLMLMCATGGYYIAQKLTHSEESKTVHDTSSDKEHTEEERYFPNLPASITGTYSVEEDIAMDTNDYLVIRNGNLVNLYILNKEGDLIFDRILDIAPDSLTPDDFKLLTEGIILDTKAELLSLIEDYSS